VCVSVCVVCVWCVCVCGVCVWCVCVVCVCVVCVCGVCVVCVCVCVVCVWCVCVVCVWCVCVWCVCICVCGVCVCVCVCDLLYFCDPTAQPLGVNVLDDNIVSSCQRVCCVCLPEILESCLLAPGPSPRSPCPQAPHCSVKAHNTFYHDIKCTHLLHSFSVSHY